MFHASALNAEHPQAYNITSEVHSHIPKKFFHLSGILGSPRFIKLAHSLQSERSPQGPELKSSVINIHVL
jgi:hypothetical protein